ncbi:MAG: M28 family metallopeptidase [Nannocystaceae bacterium]|nr:M20/M25/M40 family metallo-hydrolase [bacterium]
MSRASSWTLALSLIVLPACERGSAGGPASPADATPAAQVNVALDPQRLVEDIEVLADDGWAGRFTKDLEHLSLAANYIAKSHEAAGLRPVGDSFLVDFEYPAGKKPGDGFYLWLEREADTVQLPEAEVVPAFFGPRRAVVGPPVWVAADSVDGVKGRPVLTPAPSGDLPARIKALADAGASAVLLVGDASSAAAPVTEGPISAAFISPQTARETLGIVTDAPRKAAEVANLKVSLTRSEVDKTGTAPNVLAWIEGSEHPEEIVLLGAHYDHIGTKEFGTFCRGPSDDADPDDAICNGADDNASGTSVLMNIARAMGSSGYRPKRTIVFASFAAEELGLHGSRALAEHPPAAAPFSSGTVVAMLNMDMVGRLGEEGLQVGGEKTSAAWPALIAAEAPASLKIVHPASVTGRSDHAHWYRMGVPVLFFFTGLHDDYHRTSDELSTLNLEGMTGIAELILGVTLALAEGAPVPPAPR